MADPQLSQEEVDALLEQNTLDAAKAADGESDSAGGETADGTAGEGGDAQAKVQRKPRPATGVRLGQQPRIVRTPLPGLDAIHQSAVAQLQVALAQFTGQSCTVTVNPAQTETYGAFIARQPTPASLNVLAIKPLYGNALLVVHPQLLFGLIDALFGGSGRFPAPFEGRAFSPSEQRVIQRLTGHFCTGYMNAWRSVFALELEPTRSEMNPQSAEIAAPGEMMLSAEISVSIGAASGALSFCVPCATLEPIRDKLSRFSGTIAPDPADRRRIDALAAQIKGAQVELVAELASGRMTVAELLALKVGDFVEFDLKETLLARIGNVPMMRCGYGVSAGRYALRVQELLTGATPNPQE